MSNETSLDGIPPEVVEMFERLALHYRSEQQRGATVSNETSLDGIPPEVVEMFERLALQLLRQGHEHYSARAILHRIRWHYTVDQGQRDFKCNNNWTPRLSRWLMQKYPTLDEFFEIRASPNRHDMTDYDGPYEGKST